MEFLVPAAVIALALFAYTRGKHKGQMTAERKVVFDSALQMLKDPAKLNALADAFDKQGLSAEATLLRKRANLRSLPRETVLARRAVFKKLMASTDPAMVETGAQTFENEGATGAAQQLREYAKGLRANVASLPLAKAAVTAAVAAAPATPDAIAAQAVALTANPPPAPDPVAVAATAMATTNATLGAMPADVHAAVADITTPPDPNHVAAAAAQGTVDDTAQIPPPGVPVGSPPPPGPFE